MMKVYISLNKKRDDEIDEIEKYKEQLNKIRDSRIELIIEESNLLAPAIENQAQDEYYRYLTSCCTEKLIKKEKEEKWENVWVSFDEFLKDRSKVRMLAVGKFTKLLFSV